MILEKCLKKTRQNNNKTRGKNISIFLKESLEKLPEKSRQNDFENTKFFFKKCESRFFFFVKMFQFYHRYFLGFGWFTSWKRGFEKSQRNVLH